MQVKYLKFFRLFFEDDVFVYCLLSVFGLSLLALGRHKTEVKWLESPVYFAPSTR